MADSKEFLNRIISAKGPELDEEQRSFTSERQHAAQAFNLHVALKDGMRTDGFAWSHYSGYRWTDEGSTERLVVLFGARAVEIEGQNLGVLVAVIREGQLNGIQELASSHSTLLKRSNPDNQPIVTRVSTYPDFDDILKTIKGEDEHEARFTRRLER